MEHYIYDERGRIRNLGAMDYRIPTSMDLPWSFSAKPWRTPTARVRMGPRG